MIIKKADNNIYEIKFSVNPLREYDRNLGNIWHFAETLE